VFDRSVIPDVSHAFQRRFPHCRLLTKGKHSISLVRELRNGVLDAAFIGLHTQAPGLVVDTIHAEPMVVALPASHRLASKRALGAEDLDGAPMFWFARALNPGFYDYCQGFFDEIGFRPAVMAEPPDHHILLGLIAEGQGLALMARSLASVKRKGVVFRPVKGALTRMTTGIALAWSGANRSPFLAPFLDMVKRA
jgi:DNA-binding transcriptional LysR family regulator